MTKKLLGRHNKTAKNQLIFKETNQSMHSGFLATGLISTVQSKAQGLTFTNPINRYPLTEGYK